MIDEKSTKIKSIKEEIYFSKWIEEKDIEEFKRLMADKIKSFKQLKHKGYEVEIYIDERFDSDCFAEKDVVIVQVSLRAESIKQPIERER